MVSLSYGATSLFTTCSVLEIWWLKLQLKSCSEMGVPVLRLPEHTHTHTHTRIVCPPLTLGNGIVSYSMEMGVE